MPNKEYLLRKPREQYLLQTLEIRSFLRLNLKKTPLDNVLNAIFQDSANKHYHNPPLHLHSCSRPL